MNPAPPEPVPNLPDRLALIIAALCRVLAVGCARDAAMAPLGLLLWRRLHRGVARFRVLFLQWREGRLPPTRHRPRREQSARGPVPRLPQGFAWLVRLVPQAAVHGTHLQILLAEPDMAAFLAEAPRAGRMLRPLCHMLGVRPLPDAVRPRTPTPEPPAKPAPSPPFQIVAPPAADPRKLFSSNEANPLPAPA